MSVIFEALQKLRASEEVEEEKELRPTDRGNTKTLKSIVFSPGLLILFLAIGAMGWFVYYYLTELHVGGGVSDRGRVVAVATNPSEGKVLPRADGPGMEKEVQGPGFQEILPPPSISYQEAKVVRLSSNSEAALEQAEPTYLPPLADSGDQGHTVSYDERIGQTTAPAANPNASSSQGMPGVPPPQASLKGGIDPFKGPSLAPQKEIEPRSSASSIRSAKGQSSVDRGVLNTDHTQKSISPLLLSSANKQVNTQEAGSGVARDSYVTATIPTSIGQNKERPEKAISTKRSEHDEAYRRTVEISSLVSQFYKALSHGEEGETEKIIKKLVVLKGADHPFIMKIKAYWHMKKQEWAHAKEALEQVLGKRPADLEAGINMAIVDIRLGRMEEARRRLKTLREIYPGNGVVSDLLAKLPRSY